MCPEGLLLCHQFPLSDTLFDLVFERAYGIDSDTNQVAGVERKRVRRDDAGAGHEQGAVGKTVIAEEILNESGQFALQLGKRDVGRKSGGAAAEYLETDGSGGWQRLWSNEPGRI